MVWAPGQSLQDGKYIIDRVLGVGGFGITYLARRRGASQEEKRVVIKTLKDEVLYHPDLANDRIRLEQDFLNEALKLAQCRHPHVVQVKKLILEEVLDDVIDGIVMEYIQGENLADRLSRQGRLPETEALRYIRQVGEALIVVHSQGLLHRDIKPQNIMIRSSTSEAVLIDFGFASEFIQNLPETHPLALTHGFAAPEQYDQQTEHGAYTDVYAMAATLYCLLTKRTPPPALRRLFGTVLQSPKQLNPGISDRVNQSILEGLELRANNRPQSMQEWLGLLEEPIDRPVVAPLQSVPGQSVNSTPQRSLGLAQNKTPARRRSRIIPWRSLAFILAGCTFIGTSYAVSSAPLWVWTGPVAWSVAWAGVGVEFWAVAWVNTALIAWTTPVVIVWIAAWITNMTETWAMTWALNCVSTTWCMTWALTWTWIGACIKLIISFSRLHTFLILAGTSLGGLGLGWLIGTVLRSSYPQIFGML